MARLRHSVTGVVVNVSDDKARALRSVFEPVAGTKDSGTPALSATKAEWVDHAVSSGADRGEAESMTKAELQEQYG